MTKIFNDVNMESMNDKLSIKNLLFSKPIPNYVIPVPTMGHKLFPCIDCGDKFILESSYVHHIERKSVKISYLCRNCNKLKLFYNRCNLLGHIRSHAFKTATINVVDLKIEPLPLSFFKSVNIESNEIVTLKTSQGRNKKVTKTICFECKVDVTDCAIVYKDRAKHYMQVTNEVHSCPVCMFALPTTCALRAHLRVHLKCPPYYCPECGIHLSNKSIFYPYNHDCDGFKMMRATARLKCPIAECSLFHPNEYKEHLKDNHLKKVYKCPKCFVACFDEHIMSNHLKTHKWDKKPFIFYQCEICPGRLVLQNQIDNHLKTHDKNYMYPCWSCGTVFKDVLNLIDHHILKHDLPTEIIKDSFDSIIKDSEVLKPKRTYRVVKRCGQCKRSFSYQCKFEQIRLLPNNCPYKCSSTSDTNTESDAVAEKQIICHMCKDNISENWEDIKKHYALNHKAHRCLDVKLVLTKLDVLKITSNKSKNCMKRNKMRKNNNKHEKNVIAVSDVNKVSPGSKSSDTNGFVCNKCGHPCENKEQLETHLISHRDPAMAYQCLECGESFAVKPSLSTHLLLEHDITDVQDYASKKQCYNENALIYQFGAISHTEPLRENQCRICRDQFDCADDLEKHFRVHGMAFLMKNNLSKNK